MDEFTANDTQIDMFPDDKPEKSDYDRIKGSAGGKRDKHKQVIVRDWLRVSNALIKRVDRDLSEMPEDLRRATVSELLQLLSRLL